MQAPVDSPVTSHTKKSRRKDGYPYLVPRTREWPSLMLTRNRRDFIRRLVDEVSSGYYTKNQDHEEIRRTLEETVYKEKTRVARYNWRIDRALGEEPFWNECERQLFLPVKEEKEHLKRLLRTIITHYAEEITSKFKPGSYRMVKRAVIWTATSLLNAVHAPFNAWIRGKRLRLSDKVHVRGHAKELRALAQKGVLVLTPNHMSHADSVLMGWVMDYLGIPPLIYGAGINLFNMRIFRYFLGGAGGYKLDRRKKNRIYLDTLQTFSKNATKYGCHSLFFPSGTRSRSGEILTKLKKGLLSTTIVAQREFCAERNSETDKEKQEPKKVFIVPVVINYHFVLEAPSLIREHLKNEGKSRYYEEEDMYSTSYKIFKLLFALLTKGSNLSVTIGRAMDVLGNYVNQEGESLDGAGRSLHVCDYFLLNGRIKEDKQREYEYTQVLSDRIKEECMRYNHVLSSYVVAFVALRLVAAQQAKEDIYDLLRMPEKEIFIPIERLTESVIRLQKEIGNLVERKVLYDTLLLEQSPEDIIKEGIAYCGMYHSKRPLVYRKGKSGVGTQDLPLLYYYHNTLNGYGLEAFI